MFEKLVHNNPNIDLVSDNEYKKLVEFFLFILKILSQNQILTPIKGLLQICKKKKQKKNALQSQHRSIQ